MFRSRVILPLLLVLLSLGEAPGALLNRMQSGTATLAAGSSTSTVSIVSVDTNRAFLVFGHNGSANNPTDLHVSGRLTSPTQVTFVRSGTGGAVTLTWYVAEFVSGVSVQRGSAGFTTRTNVVTITPVTLTNSFALLSYLSPGGTFSGDDFARAQLTSSTNLVLTQGDPALVPPDIVEWQVVEYADARVRSGDVTLGPTNLSATVTLSPPFDPTASWLVHSYFTDEGLGFQTIGQLLVRGTLSGTTNLVFDRDALTTSSIGVTWFLVEFQDQTRVQHASAGFGVTSLTNNVAINPVDTNRSFAVGGYHGRGGKSPYLVVADDDAGVGWFNFALTASNNLLVTRGSTGTVSGATADVGWFVLEFEGQADLAVFKSASPEPVVAGRPLVYSVLVTNQGPFAATGVEVAEILPPEVSFVSATPSVGTYDATTGVWNVGSLAAGDGATLSLNVTVDPGAL